MPRPLQQGKQYFPSLRTGLLTLRSQEPAVGSDSFVWSSAAPWSFKNMAAKEHHLIVKERQNRVELLLLLQVLLFQNMDGHGLFLLRSLKCLVGFLPIISIKLIKRRK